VNVRNLKLSKDCNELRVNQTGRHNSCGLLPDCVTDFCSLTTKANYSTYKMPSVVTNMPKISASQEIIFYGIRKFITVFITAHKQSTSCAKLILFKHSHPIPLRFMLLSYSHITSSTGIYILMFENPTIKHKGIYKFGKYLPKDMA
jgi:hypothetical protein